MPVTENEEMVLAVQMPPQQVIRLGLKYLLPRKGPARRWIESPHSHRCHQRLGASLTAARPYRERTAPV